MNLPETSSNYPSSTTPAYSSQVREYLPVQSNNSHNCRSAGEHSLCHNSPRRNTASTMSNYLVYPPNLTRNPFLYLVFGTPLLCTLCAACRELSSQPFFVQLNLAQPNRVSTSVRFLLWSRFFERIASSP